MLETVLGKETREEWETWQSVVHEWPGGAINDKRNDRVVAAIRLWGEKLVALRLTQTDTARLVALEYVQYHYDRLKETENGA